MKTAAEVEDFRRQARRDVILRCKECNLGADPDCGCHARFRLRVAAFEASVPRDFWEITAEDIAHNKGVFDTMVRVYASKLKLAMKRGYGLLFLGANGVGKTTFISWVLMEAIRAGRSAYYTTLPQLDYDIKRGFTDDAARERLEWLLTSDFVAIDEVGKEHFKGQEGSWTKTQLERILKERFDDSAPVLLATNMDYSTVEKTYGPTMASIFNGKYQQVTMLPGDFRENLRKKMDKDMRYGK